MKNVLPAPALVAVLLLGLLSRLATAQMPTIPGPPQPASLGNYDHIINNTPLRPTLYPSRSDYMDQERQRTNQRNAQQNREMELYQQMQRANQQATARGETPPYPQPGVMLTGMTFQQQQELIQRIQQQRQVEAMQRWDEQQKQKQSRQQNSQKTVLQLSDLSPQRKAELQAALQGYDQAFQQLASIYVGKQPISIKRAVYIVENAYLEKTIPYESYCRSIQELVKLIWQQIPAQHRAKPSQNDKHLALYQVMCDTTWRYDVGGQRVGMHLPMGYDFWDYRGEEDYRQMFVSKLLEKGTGQCHSLPLLYRILAEEMGLPAYISYTPNHSYIQHPDQAGNWYNLELTNGRYVTKSSLMDFGYIKFAALKNRVYMDTLSLRQTVGACLMDLALGYDAKFGAFGKKKFIRQCSELVLSQESNHVQALIVQGGLVDAQVNRAIRQSGIRSPEEIKPDSQIYKLHQLQEQIYARIEGLGYAEMPKAKYEAWRASLGREQIRRQSQSILQQMQPKQ